MFALYDFGPSTEDALHHSISKVSISDTDAVSALLAFLKAMMPFVESPMHCLHLMLILHLFTHLIHKPTALPVEDKT